MFKDILLYFYLIIIHELGHFLMGCFLGWRKSKIYLYIYGGCTKFNIDINHKSIEEFFVLIMGPIFQILGTIILGLILVKQKDTFLLYKYSVTILVFNLLPIYPLDGGRLVNLFFNKCLSFRKSFIISIISSITIIVLILALSIKHNLKFNFIYIFIFLFYKVIEELRKKNYYYHKFILERYLNNYNYKKYKVISNIKDMMKEKKHVFAYKNRYFSEKEILQKRFKNS